MLLILILGFIYIGSFIACVNIMIERGIDPNPVSIFIVICPIVNLIYTIYRSKGGWKSWFKGL